MIARPCDAERRPLRCSLLALCAPVLCAGGPGRLGVLLPVVRRRPPRTASYAHWAQDGHAPPIDIASDYYPALGAVLVEQRGGDRRRRWREVAARRDRRDRGLVVGKGLARGSAAAGRDRARRARRRIAVAVHIEPYAGRTVASIARRRRVPALARRHDVLRLPGRSTCRAARLGAGERRAARAGRDDVRPDRARRRRRQPDTSAGIYTYDTVTSTARGCSPASAREAHARGLLCAPSVGPGYDARRATGDPHVKPRRHGPTYDSMWHAAIAAGADRRHDHVVQRVAGGDADRARAPPARRGAYRYGSYDGAWGLHGAAAENGIPRPYGLLGEPLPQQVGAATPCAALVQRAGRRVGPYPWRVAARTVSAPLAQLPNALTIARLVVIPVFAALILASDGGRSWPAAIALRRGRRSPTRSTASSRAAGTSSRRSARSPTRSPTGC